MKYHPRHYKSERTSGKLMRAIWPHRLTWRKAYKRACAGLCIIGFFLMLGAAGASDLGVEPFREIALQALLGLALFSGAGTLGGFIVWR